MSSLRHIFPCKRLTQFEALGLNPVGVGLFIGTPLPEDTKPRRGDLSTLQGRNNFLSRSIDGGLGHPYGVWRACKGSGSYKQVTPTGFEASPVCWLKPPTTTNGTSFKKEPPMTRYGATKVGDWAGRYRTTSLSGLVLAVRNSF